MNNRDSLAYWSFPCGVWFQTSVRISYFFPLIVIALCFRLETWQLGLAFSAILFASILLHEFGHIIACRLTGGSGDEILLWPFGGLAFCQPAGTLSSRLLTHAGGIIVNAVLCLVTLKPVYDSPYTSQILNPFVFPPVDQGDVAILVFTANWLTLLINLLPVYPLDGGRLLQTLLHSRLDYESSTVIYLRIGMLLGLLGMFGGLMTDGTWVLFIGAVVLLLNMQETHQMRSADHYDESFMGYDFSMGYTSLEQSGQDPPPKRESLLQRWRNKRRQERERREREQAAEVEQQLDAILQKVHDTGIESLSVAERRILDRASARYRDKDRPKR